VKNTWRLGLVAASLLVGSAAPVMAQGGQGEATAVVTAVPKDKGEATVGMLGAQQIEVQVDGKKVQPINFRAYGQGPVELVILMDSGLRTSFGRNLEDLTNYIRSLPANVQVAIAYMQNGRAVFSSHLGGERESALKALHVPAGVPGESASPYFCLSDLAKNWPAPRSAARRLVVMITDGVDRYNLRYDPDDPYLRAAVDDSERAGLVIYPIYYRDQGRLSSGFYETNAGQNYLSQVAEETGGNLYWQGLSNPVSLQPFLADLNRRMGNQYELDVPVNVGKKPQLASLKVKSQLSSVKVDAPMHVAVAGEAR
jgi:hypothetical protein